MSELMKKAEVLDDELNQSHEAKRKQVEIVKQYGRKLRKLVVWMHRSHSNPPTDQDLKNMELTMAMFKK